MLGKHTQEQEKRKKKKKKKCSKPGILLPGVPPDGATPNCHLPVIHGDVVSPDNNLALSHSLDQLRRGEPVNDGHHGARHYRPLTPGLGAALSSLLKIPVDVGRFPRERLELRGERGRGGDGGGSS